MENKTLNILLADPRHSTVGSHSMFVPINIGYIGSHIINQLKDKVKINLKLSTDPTEIFDELKKNETHLLGLSNYIWGKWVLIR